ncbi:MAG: 30S ribosomal protein S3 [Deltaproteobacteria bacterium]|nr:30S ribosomal protein S3 [Deltaproteobacteria bacterium]
MGHKVNPIGMRLALTRDWDSKWYADKKAYGPMLEQDVKIQKLLKEKLKNAGVARVEVERSAQKMKITVHSARPGIIIGRNGEAADELKKDLSRRTGRDVTVNIKEIKRAEIEPNLIAQSIAQQLERRIAFRRAIKRSLQSAMRLNIQGCKIMVAGRLNGAEMSRTEWVREGRVPLHTLRANIEYGSATAQTTYGAIGVKVWVYKGEDFQQPKPMRRKA